VLFVCKTVLTGIPDQNAAFTHWENRDWAIENSKMVCQRHEIQLFDPVEGMKMKPGDDPAFPLRLNLAERGQCARVGIRLATDWDESHKETRWRVWRVGCPSLIVDTRTGEVIGYKLPECGHRDTVVCDVDSAI
jgi:hypothetical protein